MIISPPFLPLRVADQTDAEWIDTAMIGGLAGDGAYPLGFNLGWHGGLHLKAPAATSGFEPVRAIADGTVVYKRGSAQGPAAPTGDSPLNYRGRRTSNAVVVIQHDTEIGATAGVPTSVRFYSIYMHLHTVRDTVRQGQRIYRKDEIGQAGYIYGDPNRIHFEIVCDQANLERLVGRSAGNVPVAADGRTDAIFGEMYFRLPATTLAYAQEDKPPLDIPVPASGVALGEPLIVGLRFAEGDGAAATRGHAHLTTYRPNGSTLGTALPEVDAEYNLYRDADAISNAYPAIARPAPSAVFELLRFGRIIGPDTLVPDTVPHWRRINTPAGTAWVNLNSAGIFKYSDADFPQWRSWHLISETRGAQTADQNSRCEAQSLLDSLDRDDNGSVSRAEAERILSTPEFPAFLKRTICKFPSEWDATTFDRRWNWLKVASPCNPDPLSEDDFSTRFKPHLAALAFPVPVDADWRFEPREFIKAFRRCGWLSQNELYQLFPRTALRRSRGTWVSEPVTPDRTQLRDSLNDLNQALRKVGIVTPKRIAAFYANATQETQWFRLLSEGNAQAARYYPWTGRGFLQLTWPANYIKYWRFRGRIVGRDLETALDNAALQANQSRDNTYLDDATVGVTREMAGWRGQVADTGFDSTHSATAYWAWSDATRSADGDSTFVRQTVRTTSGAKVYYEHEAFGRVAATVNVGRPSTNYASINGVQARFQAYTTAAVALMDTLQFPGTQGALQPAPDDYRPRRS